MAGPLIKSSPLTIMQALMSFNEHVCFTAPILKERALLFECQPTPGRLLLTGKG